MILKVLSINASPSEDAQSEGSIEKFGPLVPKIFHFILFVTSHLCYTVENDVMASNVASKYFLYYFYYLKKIAR